MVDGPRVVARVGGETVVVAAILPADPIFGRDPDSYHVPASAVGHFRPESPGVVRRLRCLAGSSRLMPAEAACWWNRERETNARRW